MRSEFESANEKSSLANIETAISSSLGSSTLFTPCWAVSTGNMCFSVHLALPPFNRLDMPQRAYFDVLESTNHERLLLTASQSVL
jgi:hypothetical protein